MTSHKILETPEDFAEAAGEMGLPDVDFSGMTLDEVEAIAKARVDKSHPDYGRMLAARLEYLARAISPARRAEPVSPDDPRWQPGAVWEHRGRRFVLTEVIAPFVKFSGHMPLDRAEMTEANGWRYVGADAATLRPAKEIAREMVRPTTREARADGTFGALFQIGPWQTQAVTREPDTLRRVVSLIIEQRDAEHAAAERGRVREAPTSAPTADDLASAALEVVSPHIPDPWVDDVHAELLRRFHAMTAQSLDLAGRVRALAEEWRASAGAVLSEDEGCALLRCADELEAIVRECAAHEKGGAR